MKTGINKKGFTVMVINNNVNAAMSILKRRLNDEGQKKELRTREYYVSKGEKRRKNLAAAKRRQQKKTQEFIKMDSGVMR